MEMRLVRHATLVVRLGEKTLLVDPMLSPPEAMPSFRTLPTTAATPWCRSPISTSPPLTRSS